MSGPHQTRATVSRPAAAGGGSAGFIAGRRLLRAVARLRPRREDGVALMLTLGILSRTGGLNRLHPAFHALQTDAAVAGGNRGGPLLDIEGRLMGVLLDVNDTDGRGYQLRAKGSYEGNAGLGFALPMRQLRALNDRMLRDIGVSRSEIPFIATQNSDEG